MAAMAEARRAAECFVADSVTCGDEARSGRKQRRRAPFHFTRATFVPLRG